MWSEAKKKIITSTVDEIVNRFKDKNGEIYTDAAIIYYDADSLKEKDRTEFNLIKELNTFFDALQIENKIYILPVTEELSAISISYLIEETIYVSMFKVKKNESLKIKDEF